MNTVSLSQTNKTNLEDRTLKTDSKTQNKTTPEQKEDGNKKLIGALVGLGVIGVSAIGLARRFHLGKIQSLFNKEANEIQETGAKLADEAQDVGARLLNEARDRIAKEADIKRAQQVQDDLIDIMRNPTRKSAKESADVFIKNFDMQDSTIDIKKMLSSRTTFKEFCAFFNNRTLTTDEIKKIESEFLAEHQRLMQEPSVMFCDKTPLEIIQAKRDAFYASMIEKIDIATPRKQCPNDIIFDFSWAKKRVDSIRPYTNFQDTGNIAIANCSDSLFKGRKFHNTYFDVPERLAIAVDNTLRQGEDPCIYSSLPEVFKGLEEKKVSEAITTFLDKVGIGTKKATFSIDGEDFIAEIKGHGNTGTIWKITNSSGDSVAVKAFYDISLSGNCGLQEIATSWQATLDNVINVPKFYMANPASYDYVSESKYTNKPIWMMIDFIDKNKTAPKEGKMVYDWMKEYGMIHQDDQTILNGYLIDLGAIGASRGRLDDSGLLNILRMGYFKEN